MAPNGVAEWCATAGVARSSAFRLGVLTASQAAFMSVLPFLAQQLPATHLYVFPGEEASFNLRLPVTLSKIPSGEDGWERWIDCPD